MPEEQKDVSNPNLGELQKELDIAIESYRAAQKEQRCAQERSVNALNHLNSIQKRMDAAISLLKEKATPDSDWSIRSAPLHLSGSG